MARKCPYVVECKSNGVFFEEIAAFNCEGPAKWYAGECGKTNPRNEYRVVKKR